MQFNRVYPQGPSQPITSTLREDERTADQIKDLSELNTKQDVVRIGDTIPIVFCNVTGDGGVWLAPPAVRWGFQNSGKNVTSCFALTLGEGPVGAIAATDVYKGDKTSRDISLTASQTFGSIGSICSFTTSLSQSYSVNTLTYVGATGACGCPVTQTGANVSVGNGVLSVTSRSDTCIGMSTSISGVYKLRGEGNGMDGHPALLVGKTHSKFPDYNYVVTAEKKYIKVSPPATVNWTITRTFTANPDRPTVGTYTHTFSRPTRSAMHLYPANTLFIVSNVEQNIDTHLQSASGGGMSGVNALWETSYSAEREAKYIGSGTTLSVHDDSFEVRVEETYLTYHRLPTAPKTAGSGGTFQGLSILNVRAVTDTETDDHLHQVYAYLRQGLQVPQLLGGSGSSSMVADFFRYLLTRNNLVPASLIDTDSLLLSAQFNNAEGLHYSGALASATNFRDYFQRIAPFFLLIYTQTHGKPGLRPVLPINSATKKLDLSPVHTRHAFSAADISEGTLDYTYRSLEERKPFCALMLWREQKAVKPGFIRTTEVRYGGMAADGPFEQYDMSEFCTSEAHALKVGKYLLALRRRSTHSVRFQAAGTAAVLGLRPGDFITVTDSATPTLGSPVSRTQTYMLTSLNGDPGGVVSVEAEHHPVDGNGVSLISKDMLGATYDVI